MAFKSVACIFDKKVLSIGRSSQTYLVRHLQRLTTLDEYSIGGADARPNHNRCRSGETEGTGAGNAQDCYRKFERLLEDCFVHISTHVL